jgi:nucleoside 2-deoxyribosyltransferase
MVKVYLAGGMRSGWQNLVKSQTNLSFFDPRNKETNTFLSINEIGTCDLFYIQQSDIVLAYMEATNPSGIGLAAELGYAKGLGKTVILCIEPNNHHIKDKYLGFLRSVSHVVYTNLDDGILFLKNMSF